MVGYVQHRLPSGRAQHLQQKYTPRLIISLLLLLPLYTTTTTPGEKLAMPPGMHASDLEKPLFHLCQSPKHEGFQGFGCELDKRSACWGDPNNINTCAALADLCLVPANKCTCPPYPNGTFPASRCKTEHTISPKLAAKVPVKGHYIDLTMFKGNTMRESSYGHGFVKAGLHNKGYHPYGYRQNSLTLNFARIAAQLKYNYTDPKRDKNFAEWDKVNKALNHSKNHNGAPGVVFLYNYRMHWFDYKWDLQEGVFEPPPPESSLEMGQLALPGLPHRGLPPWKGAPEPAGSIIVNKGAQGLKLYITYQENVAAARYLKEVYGYKVILFDGQPGGCESPKHVAEDWKATAGHPTCSCNPHSFHIYAETFVDAVFRQYHCPGLKEMVAPIPLVVLPLGVNWHHTHPKTKPKNHWTDDPKIVPASKRKADFAFLGKMENDPSRINMHAFVERLAHARSTGCGYLSDHEEGDMLCGDTKEMKYQDVLLDSIFCPCPRGVKMESFRMTEVIESGCIPIVDDQGTHFNHAWNGIHKFAITTSRKWANDTFTGEDLLVRVVQLLNDKDELDKRQAAMMAWYVQHQKDLVQTIDDTIDNVLSGKPFVTVVNTVPAATQTEQSDREPQAAMPSKSSSSSSSSSVAGTSGGRANIIARQADELSPAHFGGSDGGDGAASMVNNARGLRRKYSADNGYAPPSTAGTEKQMAVIMLSFIAILTLSRYC